MPRRAGGDSTRLAEQQKALAEREQKLREDMERLQRVIEDAPRRAEEAEKKRREELVARANASSRRLDSPVVLDRRFEVQTLERKKRKALKGERREARLKFFVLILVLLGFIICLWTLMMS
ncbi:MAG: hypothetical protein M3O82_00875 [Verrucomicrobiota bacterium]|nr:hypothetical protein [Verrucomicrobiota bacterium]